MDENNRKKKGWLKTLGEALYMELREHRSSFIVYFTLRLLVIVMLVLQLLNRNYENVFLCGLTLLLLVVPSFVQVTFKVELPTVLEIIILIFIFAAGSTVFLIFGPKVLAQATDKLSEGIMAKVSGTGGIDFEYIAYIIWILVGLYLVSALFSYIQGFITSTIS